MAALLVHIIRQEKKEEIEKEKTMVEEQYKKRIRIEVSTSVKGVKTYSCTTEMLDAAKEEVLAESDALVKALDMRYPPEMIKTPVSNIS